MRKIAFSLFGALLIASSAVQLAAASEHHARTDRDHHRWDRAYNQQGELFPAPQIFGNYQGKPDIYGPRACDKTWCYGN
jgi:hypothetical protein